MQPLSEFSGRYLEWLQPKTFDTYYELRSEEQLMGTLTFRSSFGTLAVAETGEGKWSFKRVGFLNPRVTVRSYGSERDLAIYQPKFWGDGILYFTRGPTLLWVPTNFWRTDWAFLDQDERQIVSFKGGVAKEKLKDILKRQTTLELVDTIRFREQMPLLATLGMYLIILHHQDAAGAVAATTATIG